MAEALYTPSYIKMTHKYTLDTHSMMDNHYTYDVPDEHAVDDLSCPYCGGAELVEIEV